MMINKNTSDTAASGILKFLHQIEYLKKNKRTGWLNKGIIPERVESISDHMYRMSIIVQLIQDPNIDINKCIKMCLVHDMAEAITGDITPDVEKAKIKHQLETDAMNQLKDLLGCTNGFGEEAFLLWKEYCADETAEAKFIKDVDKFELILQAVEYESRNENIKFDDWIDGCKDKIRHPLLKETLSSLLKERVN